MQNFCIQNERIKEMTKLALSDEILMKIDKPARYIGNELNSVCKNKDEVSIRLYVLSDVYEISMSIWASRFSMICLIRRRCVV